MMTWREAFDAIGEGRLRGACLFHGEEEYIKAEALSRLRARLLPAGLEALNETALEASASAQRIIEASETVPMFCERRLVIVRDWAPLGSAKAKGEAEEVERLAQWLPNAPESCVTVFYTRGNANGNKAATKALKSAGTEARFSPLDDATLRQWVRQKAREAGKGISSEACDALFFAAGGELTRLAGEIGKLAAYADGRAEISAADVRAMVTPTPESTVFEMIDALTAGRFARAQSLLALLLNAGEPRVRTLYMITRQARLLCFARLLLDRKKSPAEIQSALEVKSAFGAKKIVEQARRMPADSLLRAYRECVQADFSIKSGAVRDDAALNRIMLTLAKLYSGK